MESKAEQGKSDEKDIRNCRSFKLRTDIESEERTQPMTEHILCMQQIQNPISVTSSLVKGQIANKRKYLN